MPALQSSTTPSFTPTTRPTPTFEPAQATVEAAIDSCDGRSLQKYVRARELSSGGEWIAVVCGDNGIYTKVSYQRSEIVWNLPALDLDESILGPEWFLEPYRWSNDGRYLYLMPSVLGFSDCPSCFPIDGFGLFRMNLLTGKLETWFEPTHEGYNFSFSPDERFFVYSDPDDLHVVRIRNQDSGKESALRFKEKYVDFGRFVWTTESSELLIVTGMGGYQLLSLNSGYSLLLYDLRDGSLKILIDNDPRQLIPASKDYSARPNGPWLSNEVLLLVESRSDATWMLNIRTGKLLPYVNPVASPTRIP